MKKFFALALMLAACVSFVGCGGAEVKKTVDTKTEEKKVETPEGTTEEKKETTTTEEKTETKTDEATEEKKAE